MQQKPVKIKLLRNSGRGRLSYFEGDDVDEVVVVEKSG